MSKPTSQTTMPPNRTAALQMLQRYGFHVVGDHEFQNLIAGRPLAAAPTSGPEPLAPLPPSRTLTGDTRPFTDPWSGRTTDLTVDPYGANPVVTYIQASMPGATFAGGPAPTMFSSCALPLITGSGAPPEVLWSVRWELRHAAAVVASKATLLKIIEESAEVEPDIDRLLTRDGKALRNDYLLKVRCWAVSAPVDGITEVEADALTEQLFGPSAT